MTDIIFYEKPGCGGNTRQRAALEAAGHTLQRRDLLSAPWTRTLLLEFLAPLPVADWFNRAAPRVKSSEVLPDALNAVDALNLLLADPLLIRRPLMQRSDNLTRHVGFDTAAVHAWVGLGTKAASGIVDATAGATPLEGCAAAAERCAASSVRP